MGKDIRKNMEIKSKNQKRKTAVIVGATGNLGGAICKLLRSRGYAIDETWFKKNHPDATKADSYKRLPPKIDLAVYCAGVNVIEKTEHLKEIDWDRVMNINLKGAFLFAKSAFPSMKRARGATLVVISSIMATHPYPYRLAYASSKAALEGLTRELAVEWGKYGISSSCIRLGHLSGLMKTTPSNPQLLKSVKSKTPLKKLIDPKDVARFILFIAEESNGSLSGSVVDFDAAYTINRWPF